MASKAQTTISFQCRKTRSQTKKKQIVLDEKPSRTRRTRRGGTGASLEKPRADPLPKPERPPLSPRKRPSDNTPRDDSPSIASKFCPSPTKRKKENQPEHAVPSKTLPSTPTKNLPRPNIPSSPSPLKMTLLKKESLCPISRSGAKKRLASPERRHQSPTSPWRQSLRTPSPRKQATSLRLQRQDATPYQSAKKALHTAVPDYLLCREKETKVITDFLEEHAAKQQPGSLYISGAPGTGKTACLTHIMRNMKESLKSTKMIFVNCMAVKNAQGIFSKVASELSPASTTPRTAKDASRLLEKQFKSKGPMIILVLDELDSLDSKNQEVLYTMFEWPTLPKSRLILIGIANALDLTDRILPRLQSRPKCRPQLLNFEPYSKDQLVTIVQDRLHKATAEGAPVLEPMAVQFCARKVSAVAGDVRKALDICRRAVEMVESDVRSQAVFKPVSPAKGSPAKSPRKSPKTPVPKKVGLSHIASVVSEVYSSRMVASTTNQQQTFPLQQKLVVCTLLLMLKSGKTKEITLGKLHEVYSRICKKRQVANVDQSEFLSLCTLIETRGILTLKKAKEARMTKVSLRMEEAELEFALQDKVLMSSILKEGIPT
ncbi:CDC6 [Branchiostoma lanceolatum]|uniref:Cell division control protein n=1 Tax=Branchiostoma lanceolatum TaxID=7740 RepID=A0A8J9Z9F6_BRALA|nr:CDC6 [Branchiostoma lanceolatum]